MICLVHGLYRLYRYGWFVQSMVYMGCITDMDDLSNPWYSIVLIYDILHNLVHLPLTYYKSLIPRHITHSLLMTYHRSLIPCMLQVPFLLQIRFPCVLYVLYPYAYCIFLILWHTICPLSLTYLMSPTPWYTTNPLSPYILHIRYLCILHISNRLDVPYSPARLYVPYLLTDYMSHIPW